MYFVTFMVVLLGLLRLGRAPFSTALLLGSVVGGLFFGFAIGAHYAHGRRKYGLPAWDQIKGD
ncbi:MAG: DUF6404 family protein [Pseudomonadota bacterium]|nr:DUF6404 family protein [Pseudomonadota bacterium]